MHKARRIVIKLGTQVVMALTGKSHAQSDDSCFAQARLAALTHQCAALIRQEKELILVSSGAIGLGRQALAQSKQVQSGQWSSTKKLKLNEKQACAAIGQALLMDAYRDLFEASGLLTAQVLLTASDFADQKHYLNLRQTLETLLTLKVIPVINENDATSVMEIQEEHRTHHFGDNDMLSALVASKLDADLLVILTDVAGIYTGNPETCSNAQKLSRIPDLETLQSVDASGQSSLGRGGMSSKLEAAKVAAYGGVSVYIASGLQENPLAPLLEDASSSNTEWSGTLVSPFCVRSTSKEL